MLAQFLVPFLIKPLMPHGGPNLTTSSNPNYLQNAHLQKLLKPFSSGLAFPTCEFGGDYIQTIAVSVPKQAEMDKRKKRKEGHSLERTQGDKAQRYK